MSYNPIEDDLKFETIKEQVIEELGEAHFEKDKGYWITYFKAALKQNKEQALIDIVFRWRKELRESERNENRDSIFNPAGYLHNLISKEINIHKNTMDIARIDNNLVDYAFYRQGKRSNEPIVYSKEHKNDITGNIVKSEWRVDSNSLIPNDQDADVFKVILKILQDSGMPTNNKVHYSNYEICKHLNISDGGENYKMINNALQYIFDSKISTKDAYLKFKDKIFLNNSDVFAEIRLIQSKEIIGSKSNSAESMEMFKNEIVLSQYIADNMRLYYSAILDWDFYISLRFSVSKRIYEILQKERQKTKKIHYEFMLLSFAQQVGMSVKVTRNIKHNMKNALEELQSTGYLKQFEIIKKNTMEYISFSLARA